MRHVNGVVYRLNEIWRDIIGIHVYICRLCVSCMIDCLRWCKAMQSKNRHFLCACSTYRA